MNDRPYRYFSSGLEQLETLGGGGDPGVLPEFFRDRIRECNTAYRHDELITVGLFDDLARALAPGTAFDLIPAAVDLAMEWRDGAVFDLAIALLGAIVRASGTTEMPPALDAVWGDLRAAVEAYLGGDQLANRDLERSWSTVADWYRRV